MVFSVFRLYRSRECHVAWEWSLKRFTDSLMNKDTTLVQNPQFRVQFRINRISTCILTTCLILFETFMNSWDFSNTAFNWPQNVNLLLKLIKFSLCHKLLNSCDTFRILYFFFSSPSKSEKGSLNSSKRNTMVSMEWFGNTKCHHWLALEGDQ